MIQVQAQINSRESCPKREHRAWYWETVKVKTLAEAIDFLLDHCASGFIISEDGVEIASKIAEHY